MLKKILPAVLLLTCMIPLRSAELPCIICEKSGVKKSIDLPGVIGSKTEKIMLRFKAYGMADSEAGCNYSVSVMLNGKEFAGKLQGTGVVEYLRKGKSPLKINRVRKNALLIMYAPTAERAERMTADGRGSIFEFDVTELVKNRKCNTLEVVNTRIGKSNRMETVVKDIELIRVPAKQKMNTLMQMPLEVLAELKDVIIPQVQTEQEFDFPAMPEKADMVPVLRCKLYSYSTAASGCNFNVQIKVNGKYLTRYTEHESERLIGRNPVFGLILGKTVREFPVFAGNNIMTVFAPDAGTADMTVTDRMGGTFIFDISDRVRGVDGNSIVFRNIRAQYPGRMDLLAQNIQIGYMRKKDLPQTANKLVSRGRIADMVKHRSLTLLQGSKGGFVLKNAAGQQLMAETLMSVSANGKVLLRAEDGGAVPANAVVTTRKNADGYSVKAELVNGLVMERVITLQDDLLKWREIWTNKSSKNLGVPFRHRFALLNTDTKFYVAGDGDNGSKLSAPANPTLFLQDKKTLNGFGISAENDWTRLLVGLRANGGTAEFYSNQLALPPGKSIELAFAINCETSGKGYWGFINRLRRRWLGTETLSAPAPFFWRCKFQDAPGKDAAEKVRNAYNHLGPTIVAATRWSRLGGDISTVVGNRYPKRADGSVDTEKFTTFEHRKFFSKEYAEHLKLLAENAPEAKLIVMTHPAMEVVYTKDADKWPYAADAIKTAAGKCFNEPYYSRAHLGKKRVDEGWAIYYYVPRQGGKYAQLLLNDIKHQLGKLGGPGVYFDEFTFGGSTRGYSRYDYSSSDGYSADLDSNGNVLHFKSDNAMTAGAFRRELTDWVAGQGKYFYANGGGPALMSEQRMPVLFFVEGGNGHGNLALGHLSQVPLALGNYGDFKSRKGIFEAAKAALSIGSVYSPHWNCNLLLKHRNEFLCRMYPITVMELNSGTITGKERLITSRSGTFGWNVADGAVDLYIYNAAGDWIGAVKPGTVRNGTITLQVPANGMVIAERK
ncbi:MAG: hypothetical protein IKD10_06690 [Lentisphaeria bacterium]|nr:hypothetical protein [Lentisphaeria bacterium]